MRALAVGALLFFPTFAFAHAFGQQFTLPLPVAYYIVGGLMAFIASCLIIFAVGKPSRESAVRVHKTFTVHRVIPSILRFIGLLLLAGGISAGIWGSPDYWINPLPNLFWIILMLGFTYVSAIVSGLWNAINPFKTIAKLIVEGSSRNLSHRVLAYLPTTVLFALLWLELFSAGLGARPIVLALVCVLYMLVSIAGSYACGVEKWFREYDFFTVFFGLVGRLAPIEFSSDRITISSPIARLSMDRAQHWGILAFILMLLGSTVLDGLRETQAWRDFLFALHSYGIPLGDYIGVIFLALIPAILLGVYCLAIYLMGHVAHTTIPTREYYLRFAYSLVPIALAYHFAHYIGLLVSEGQRFIAQISDPYSFGWNLFGTADRAINITFVGADTVWYIQLSAIVIGHVIAAIVAHRIALAIFPQKNDAIKSQIPMLVLMVGYTAFGLWTLSQPFVTG